MKKIHEYKNGKFKDVPCFTVVDFDHWEDMGEIRSEMTCRGSSAEVKLYELDKGWLDDDVCS